MHDVALLAADTARARAYLSLLEQARILPRRAVFIAAEGFPAAASREPTERFDNVTSVPEQLERLGIPFVTVKTDDINHETVAAHIAALEQKVVIFAGPGGAIVRAPLFETGKEFLHVHPGQLPQYRGSTTMYYSLLDRGELFASAILLAPSIDAGPVVGERRFDLPTDCREIDHGFDPWMRATLLVDVVSDYSMLGAFKIQRKQVDSGETWYVIHPILKHIAILSGPSRSQVLNKKPFSGEGCSPR